MMVVFISVAAMLFKSVLDVLNKLCVNGAKNTSSNEYFFVHSFFSGLFLAAAAVFGFLKIQLNTEYIFYGLAGGLLIYISYLLFLSSLKSENSTICIVVYRLNFVVSSIISLALFNEKITAGKSIGILACVLATFMFLDIKKNHMKIDKLYIFSILSCVIAGCVSSLMKHGINKGADSYLLVFYSQISLFIFMLLDIGVRKININVRRIVKDRKFVILAAIAGIIMVVSLFLMYYAMSVGDLSIVSPISQSSFIFTAAFAVIVFKEKINRRQIFGFILAVLCIAVIGL